MRRGHQHTRLLELFSSDAVVEISSVAWYEFSRGPRTPPQLAVARSFFAPGGVLAFSEELAERAADLFRRLGSPRRRAGDIAIAAVALSRGATLLTNNSRDYADIEGLTVEQPH